LTWHADDSVDELSTTQTDKMSRNDGAKEHDYTVCIHKVCN